MMQIDCPWCGPRNAAEFHHHGEITPRPDVNATTMEQWHDYLYFRENPNGVVEETWYHGTGCRRFFRLRRNTLTNSSTLDDGGSR